MYIIKEGMASTLTPLVMRSALGDLRKLLYEQTPEAPCSVSTCRLVEGQTMVAGRLAYTLATHLHQRKAEGRKVRAAKQKGNGEEGEDETNDEE